MRDDRVFLKHIRDAAQNIIAYTKALSFDAFISSQEKMDAVIRNFEIIGEAAGNVSEQGRVLYGELPWREMIDFRNRLIHGYFSIDVEIVWDAIRQEIPVLLEKVSTILEKV